jgi:transcriptional regulator with XRE-family HTH domain
MDVVRFGLGVRALRLRRRLTQDELARRTKVSRGVIWRIERGLADRVAVHTLVRIAAALDARVDLRLLWHGEGLDRLLDARHAALVEQVLADLDAQGWNCRTEVSFSIRGERGAIDVLACHQPSRALLVVEVKSVVPDLQATLGTLDRKVRLAREIAIPFGWGGGPVSRLLVLPGDRTAHRRVAAHASTFNTSLPARTWAVRRWLRKPVGEMQGILFLPLAPQESNRQRPGRARGQSGSAARSTPITTRHRS